MSKPIISRLSDGYAFKYLKGREKGVVVRIRNLEQDNNRNVIGTLDIGVFKPEPLLICRGIKLTLTSIPSREQIAKYLFDHHFEDLGTPIPWDELINQICNLTLKRHDAIVEIKEIKANSEVKPLKYLVSPVLPFGVPTIIFGEPGSGKSYIAILLALVAQEPSCGYSLGLIAMDKPVKALYLDFEFNEGDLEERWPSLSKGIGRRRESIHYLACHRPLAELANSIRKEIKNGGFKLLILDSLLGAAGGNPNEAEPVLRLMNTLKGFDGVTALIIAHTSKIQTKGKKSTYGSVFYEAYARSVWECRMTQEPGENEMVTTLYHRKINSSKKELPIGLHWTFAEDSITVVRRDLKNTKHSDASNVASQIIDVLKQVDRKMTVKNIAKELGKPEKIESIRLTLKRMEKKGEVKHFSDKKWGLPK